MITLNDIRSYAMALPDVEERTHFGLPGFRVRDELFVHLEKGNASAILSVRREDAEAAVLLGPNGYEEVWRNSGRIFVGLRVDLAKLSRKRVRELVQLAWRNKAPKRLVAAYDEAK